MSPYADKERRSAALLDNLGHPHLPESIHQERRKQEVEELLKSLFKPQPKKPELVGIPRSQGADAALTRNAPALYIVLAFCLGTALGLASILFLKHGAFEKVEQAFTIATDRAVYEWHGNHRVMPAPPPERLRGT